MNEVRRFLAEYQIMPADGIVARKRGLNLLDHYIVYLGVENEINFFITNLEKEGVKVIDEYEVIDLLNRFQPINILKFTGNEYERKNAVNRALSQIGKPYSLISNNCEHLSNYIQSGSRKSSQIGFFSSLLILGLIVLGIKNRIL